MTDRSRRNRRTRGLSGALALGSCLWIVLATGCVSTPVIRDRRVIVMNFENTIVDPQAQGLSGALAEMVAAQLINYPRVVIIDRQDLNTLYKDVERRPNRWQPLGSAAGADYLIVGSISRLDHNYIINARIFSVASGEIIQGSSVTRSCPRDEDLYPVAQVIGRIMAHHLRVLAQRHDALVMNESWQATQSNP